MGGEVEEMRVRGLRGSRVNGVRGNDGWERKET